jgi:hypothetical protein
MVIIEIFIFTRFGMLYQEKSGNPGEEGGKDIGVHGARLEEDEIMPRVDHNLQSEFSRHYNGSYL